MNASPTVKTQSVWKSTNTNLLGCRAHLTVISNHPRRGFHNCQLLTVNCQFISESAILLTEADKHLQGAADNELSAIRRETAFWGEIF